VKVAIGQESFHFAGLVILERNFLDVYPYWKWEGNTIPRFQVGETIAPTDMYLEESKTSPPKLLSEPDLIGLMDKHGIGTDATIAEHIAKIQERQYVLVENALFRPTTLGEALVAGAYRFVSLYFPFFVVIFCLV
jgi:DNA topoisomerase-3